MRPLFNILDELNEMDFDKEKPEKSHTFERFVGSEKTKSLIVNFLYIFQIFYNVKYFNTEKKKYFLLFEEIFTNLNISKKFKININNKKL